MKLINIGFGNMVSANRLVAIVSPESAPIKRIIQDAKDRGTLIDATYGRRTRAVLVTDSDHVILSAVQPETVANRLNDRDEEDEEEMDASFRPKEMLTMAVATSIDALAVGVSFAFLGMGQGEILSAAGLIAATTFVFSAVGVSVGSVFGSRFKSKAELCGGVILILIGLKILLEHLGILG